MPICKLHNYALADIGVLTKSNHSMAETDWHILKFCKIDVHFDVFVVAVFTLLSYYSCKTSTVWNTKFKVNPNIFPNLL
jgi:hypothetical protein